MKSGSMDETWFDFMMGDYKDAGMMADKLQRLDMRELLV